MQTKAETAFKPNDYKGFFNLKKFDYFCGK